MANTDTPMGLRPLRYLSGAPYNGACNRYHVASADANAIYAGGLVKMTGASDADGIPTVTGNVSTGDAIVGVMVGIDTTNRDDNNYHPASTENYIFVADDPNIVFECQEDSVGAAMTGANVGNTADLTGFTSGEPIYGRSAIEIDSSTATATGDGTQDVLIVRLAQRRDNEIGTNAVWEVRLNNHLFVDGVAGV